MHGNRLRTLGLFVVLTGLFMAVGFGIASYFQASPILGSLVFLVVAGLINFVSYFWSDRIVLWSTGARLVTPQEAPRLHRIVQHLVLRADMPMPRIAIIPSMQPNAFATGRNPKNGVVAATEGILRLLDDDELSGVMAHELAHIQNRDILTMSAAATVAGAITFAARMFFWTSLFGGGGRDGNGQNPLVGLAMMILAPIAAMLVQMAISRSREYAADATGAKICGSPISLARALRKLEQGVERIPLEVGNPSQSHMYIANPFRGGFIAGMFSTHPPMDERVRRLEAMIL